jgi:hypothetical protein
MMVNVRNETPRLRYTNLHYIELLMLADIVAFSAG